MTLHICSSLFLCALTSLAFATPSPTTTTPTKLYVGAFGGGGLSHDLNASQFGTVFIIEAGGGPLAVDSIGKLHHENTLFLGAQLGYQAQERFLSASSQWTLAPAVELESYITNSRSYRGFLHNDTVRDAEHDFRVSYPKRNTVFLANAVLNLNKASHSLHPYIGFGIGHAMVKISDAKSTQLNPPELENHYNANTSDTNATFAGQIKLGLGYDISKCVSLFAEYRWLYIATSHFVLGSAVSPNHAPTSPWDVKLDAQRYHLGNVGVRFSW